MTGIFLIKTILVSILTIENALSINKEGICSYRIFFTASKIFSAT